MKNKSIATVSIVTAVALVLGYIESLIPSPIPIPGVKLGFSNIAILFTLYKLGKKEALLVLILKVLVSCLLFSGFQAFWYSLFGGLFSLFAMISLKRTNRLSIVGVSLSGGTMHNVGQLLAAGIILKTTSVIYYLPVLLVSGAITGIITGLITKELIKKIPC